MCIGVLYICSLNSQLLSAGTHIYSWKRHLISFGVMLSSVVTTWKPGSDFDWLIISFYGRFHTCHTQMLMMPFPMACSLFGVENIYTNQTEKLVKEWCSHEYARGLWEVINFQIILHENLWTWPVHRVYYFSTDCAVVGSISFASEAYHSRSVVCGCTDRNWRGHILCCLRLSRPQSIL